MTWRQNLSCLLGHGKSDGPAWQVERDVDYVPGAALLLRSSVRRAVGPLDGDYFAYHEEVDFCLRAREQGFGVRVLGQALALHVAGAATGGGYAPARKYMIGLNSVRFMRRHGTLGRWISFMICDVLSLPLVWLLRVPRGDGAAVRAKALGLWHGLLGKRVEAPRVAAFRD